MAGDDETLRFAQGDNRGSSVRDNAVMLSAAKHLEGQRERPFAAAQGDMDDGYLGPINRRWAR
jgi:hypothetical protein